LSVSYVSTVFGAYVTYVFNEGTLMLESVTLAELVELVVEVLVNLAGCSVLDEEASENS
jgi:hypothetical protein